MSDKVDQKVLKWFGDVECMIEEWRTKRVYNPGMEGKTSKHMPCTNWLDGVRKARMRDYLS